MANIVIMGAGIGGMPAAYEMRELLPKEHTVTVVSAMDFFQFVPSNPWLAVGWRKREEIVLKIAPLLERKGIQFIAKPVTTLDAAGNKLVLSGGTAYEQVLPYDYLVITTGPKLSFDEVRPTLEKEARDRLESTERGRLWTDEQDKVKIDDDALQGLMYRNAAAAQR